MTDEPLFLSRAVEVGRGDRKGCYMEWLTMRDDRESRVRYR